MSTVVVFELHVAHASSWTPQITIMILLIVYLGHCTV